MSSASPRNGQSAVQDALSVEPPVSPASPEAPSADRPESSTHTLHSEENTRANERGAEDAAATKPKAQDDNVIVVGWDGPDDPANPRKYAVHSL